MPRIPKRESELKAALVKAVAIADPSLLVLQLQESNRAGVADVLIAGYRAITLWELKHATPLFASPHIQQITCRQLAKAGHCRYIVYAEQAYNSRRSIRVVHPDEVFRVDVEHKKLDFRLMTPIVSYESISYDHQLIAAYIVSVHKGTSCK